MLLIDKADFSLVRQSAFVHRQLCQPSSIPGVPYHQPAVLVHRQDLFSHGRGLHEPDRRVRFQLPVRTDRVSVLIQTKAFCQCVSCLRRIRKFFRSRADADALCRTVARVDRQRRAHRLDPVPVLQKLLRRTRLRDAVRADRFLVLLRDLLGLLCKRLRLLGDLDILAVDP